MKRICFFFQIHHPFAFRRYRFFDIGNSDYYYDDFYNESTITKQTEDLYISVNQTIIDLSKKLEGRFKIALSVSGATLRLLQLYAPKMTESLQELEETGCLELVCQTYANSLSSLQSNATFEKEIAMQNQVTATIFGQQPKVFFNTRAIYSDEIGEKLYNLGFKGVLTGDLKDFSHQKNNNALYVNTKQQRFKIIANNSLFKSVFYNDLVQNQNFTATKKQMQQVPNEEVFTLFDSYAHFCSILMRHKNGLENFEAFAKDILKEEIGFVTPSEVIEKVQPAASISIQHPVFGFNPATTDGELLINSMQKEAIDKLYELQPQVEQCNDNNLLTDWNNLQSAEHFLLMAKNFQSEDNIIGQKLFESPYEAFINYMNILSDFKIRLNKIAPQKTEEDVDNLKKILQEKEQKIARLQQEIRELSDKRK